MIEVTVEKMIYGGKGLARDNGLTIFIPGVIPGERVYVRIKKKRKGFAEAELIEIIKPSPDRITPPCKGEEECAGAHWPYISYPAQLRLKEEILLETLRKIGSIEPRNILPIIPSQNIDHYRLRVQFNVRYRDSRPLIGFFREGTHHLVEIKNGFLLHPLINRILDAIRKLTDQLPPLREIHINVSPDTSGEALILFFIDVETPPRPGGATIFEALRKDVKEVVGIISYAGRKKYEVLGRNYLKLRLDDFSFQSREGSFFQVNWGQNKNMINSLLDLSELKGDERVLDLYSGIGNFSLPLAKKVERVIGIESGYSAVKDALRNAEENGIKNIAFICEDVRKGLKGLLEKKERVDLIVLDPPRAGATKKIIERIIAFSPKKIIYVSCNPTTLARDLMMLQNGGYFLNRLQPIDMFPQTYHIESIAELLFQSIKNGSSWT
ncbi:MAG TPA: 23S rRNA (uracil(1939)-C(5))-methyltransferase RlmD [Nitrospiraceae bacterium]|nr:23S rRNA (uracil(1939)-C(5))-methyltransferase RlmD [Nitrospiraceae bacterium]